MLFSLIDVLKIDFLKIFFVVLFLHDGLGDFVCSLSSHVQLFHPF